MAADEEIGSISTSGTSGVVALLSNLLIEIFDGLKRLLGLETRCLGGGAGGGAIDGELGVIIILVGRL